MASETNSITMEPRTRTFQPERFYVEGLREQLAFFSSPRTSLPRIIILSRTCAQILNVKFSEYLSGLFMLRCQNDD